MGFHNNVRLNTKMITGVAQIKSVLKQNEIHNFVLKRRKLVWRKKNPSKRLQRGSNPRPPVY